MEQFLVRKATAADAGTAAEVVRRSIKELCLQDHNGDKQLLQGWLANKTEDNFRTWIDASLSSFQVLEAGIGQGFGLVTSEGELALLYVTPELLHRGAGKALLAACEEAARTGGVREMLLDSTRTARDFYKRNGFVEAQPPREGWGITSYPMVKRILT